MNDTPKLKIPIDFYKKTIQCINLENDPELIDKFGAKEIMYIPNFSKPYCNYKTKDSFIGRIFIPNDNVSDVDKKVLEELCRKEVGEDEDDSSNWNY